MKTSDRVLFDGDKLIHHKQFANDPYIEKAKQLREQHGGVQGENRLAGVVPLHILQGWAKEAGLLWSDPAFKDVIRRKLLSGDFDRLRVWGGSF
jgi:hypothetical protein